MFQGGVSKRGLKERFQGEVLKRGSMRGFKERF